MLHIHLMNADDVPWGMKLKDQAGWNQTPADWRRLLALQPEGCFVADWEGRMAGTACVTSFGPVAWISMVLVDTSYRGRGIGTRLMEHALAWLDRERIRTVRLDATPLGRPVYARLGFAAEYEVARWEGTAEPGRLGAGSCEEGWASVSRSPGPAENRSRGWGPISIRAQPSRILPVAREQLDEIAALDLQATGTLRLRLLDRLHRERPDAMRIAMTDGRIAGYSHFRPGSRARQIGPVIAMDASSGEALLDAAFHGAAGQPIYLDIPVANLPAASWAESRGLGIQRQFIRMFRGEPVLDRPNRIWAGYGPEKG